MTLAEWTVLVTPGRLHELFKIDVLQCIVFSLLILQGVARLARRPMIYAGLALAIALGATWFAPEMWRPGVGDGWWMPIRGLVNGNADRGVAALFPLFPWIAFAAFGSVLGAVYRHLRVIPLEGRARWSEAKWLLVLAGLGLALWVWGDHYQSRWLWDGTRLEQEIYRLHNTTLPSVAHRLGFVCLAGSVLGWVELLRPRWPGPNPVESASRESLLLYMLHLNLIFGIMLRPSFQQATGWRLHGLDWGPTLLVTALVIGVNLAAAVGWQAIRKSPERMWQLQRAALVLLGIWFLAGNWMTYFHFLRSPELATEPYAFLNQARIRKGLPPTPDGLSRDEREVAREKARIGMKLSEAEQRLLAGAMR